LIGNNPTIEARVVQDGGVLFNPIRDNMIRTYHAEPQITISINGIMSKCSANCGFEWSESKTPVVSDIQISWKFLF